MFFFFFPLIQLYNIDCHQHIKTWFLANNLINCYPLCSYVSVWSQLLEQINWLLKEKRCNDWWQCWGWKKRWSREMWPPKIPFMWSLRLGNIVVIIKRSVSSPKPFSDYCVTFTSRVTCLFLSHTQTFFLPLVWMSLSWSLPLKLSFPALGPFYGPFQSGSTSWPHTSR